MVQLTSESKDENKCVFERPFVECTDNLEKFTKEGDNYMKQFANLYTKRLEELSAILKDRVKAKWGKDVNLIPLADLEEQNGKRCAIIGTLYKHQPNKPSILQELSEEHQMSLPTPKPDYCSDDDQLFLEDQTSRVRLSGDKVNVKESVTGVVCAVLGSENQKSLFEVEDWCFPGCPLQKPLPKNSANVGKMVFVSGLELASTPQNLALNLFTEWLCGLNGDASYQEDEASIVRVVIAGNSIKGCANIHVSKGLVSGRAEDATSARETTLGTQRLDTLLETIGTNCCVTLMPGQFDVTMLMMPQSSMHPGSFPKARRLTSVKGVTNPWVGKISDRIITGTSGQPIQDIQKVCGHDTLEPLDWLERTLEWRHPCPTAPDTISCLPFYKSDPFILKECPNIYFVGNMEKFATKMFKGEEGQQVRLICIPKFSTTQTAVLVDLETMDAKPISFGSG
ncbi:hypothetical protein QAD02_015515 [Eretmocerus hayati]|uniref:Uncharacterized protein n=1 Tax=Eretmocerus hayati TaxID=131215 RepID=A0ACC2P9G2_9HYME|nr:hypothetical protein QAD02_015515 [Eretmocerus hayati]